MPNAECNRGAQERLNSNHPQGTVEANVDAKEAEETKVKVDIGQSRAEESEESAREREREREREIRSGK